MKDICPECSGRIWVGRTLPPSITGDLQERECKACGHIWTGEL
jgi:hypothetical protein